MFSQHNVRTVMGTAQASGVVALLAARAGLPVVFHTPSEVKAAVTGEGRAGKEQVTTMVTRLLGLAEAPRPADAADALALAICHCWRAPMLDRMAQARERSAELARRHRRRAARRARPHAERPMTATARWRARELRDGRRASGRRAQRLIAAVRGEVLEIGLDHAVVDVGGVGLAVHATPATLAGLRRGDQARLATSLVVREDSLTLFGFADAEERELFTLLQTVSGVGPRLALATLAVLDPDALRRALADGDATALTRVPGIGRKGAERMVLELRDKVVAPAPAPSAPAAAGGLRDQVVEALLGLGFPAKPAEQAVDAVLAENGSTDASTALRAALSRLGRAR